VALGALEPKFWSTFCRTIGRPDLVPLHNATGDEGARVLADVRAVMRKRSRGEWLALFESLEVCLTPVNSIAEAIDDPHITARGAVVRRGGSAYVTTPVAITDEATDSGWNRARRTEVEQAPALGAHTDAMLGDAGIAPAEIARLHERKII
jgi:crotonobetainyl-CoA:carnitine CoA-transferase CaiB-like acyl-CoA transferase